MAEFLRQVDIAIFLCVSKSRAYQIAWTETFPAQVQRRGEREFWRKIDESRWTERHPLGDRRWDPRRIESSALGNTCSTS
jgi:hypothetical protein